MPDPAVFLDRDGTLIEEVGYASRPEHIRILGGVARALIDLADAGYRLIVVTNQSGIARGYMTEDDLERFHDALDRQLHLLGAAVDAYYACPHHPDPDPAPRPDLAVKCDCRKPKPGLILRAAEDFRLDLSASWTVGDTWRDIAAGQAAGTRTIKLPADEAHRGPRPPDVAPPTAEAQSLAEATGIILDRETPSLDEAAAEPTDKDEGLAATGEPPPAPVAADTFTDEASAAAPEAQLEAVEPEPEIMEAEEEAEPPKPEAETEPEPPAETVVEALSPVHTDPYRGGRGTGEGDEIVKPDDDIPTSRQGGEQNDSAGMDQARCARCGRDIRPGEIADGTAGERDGFLLCPDCLAQQPREAGADAAAGTDDLLRLILGELQRLRRAQRPASLSLFRLLAYIAQAAALFFGFGLAVLGDDRTLYLQVALLLQLLVLALLLFERRP